MTSDIDLSQNAKDIVRDLSEADDGQARAVLEAEQAKPEAEQRKTVLQAAEARLDELAPIVAADGSQVTGTPSGAWAQLLDGDGEPVLVDGNPVDAGLVP